MWLYSLADLKEIAKNAGVAYIELYQYKDNIHKIELATPLMIEIEDLQEDSEYHCEYNIMYAEEYNEKMRVGKQYIEDDAENFPIMVIVFSEKIDFA